MVTGRGIFTYLQEYGLSEATHSQVDGPSSMNLQATLSGVSGYYSFEEKILEIW